MPERKSKYKCDNCGAENYTLEMNRDFKYIWNGPHGPPIGHENLGVSVIVRCNVCKEELDPTEEDIERLYPDELPRVTFYNNNPVSTDGEVEKIKERLMKEGHLLDGSKHCGQG